MKNILSSLTKIEKNRILEMHKSAIMKNYINEQDDKIPTLPEVKVSAWMPFETAKQVATEKNGNILMYIYNDGCIGCEGYTKKIMSDENWRNKIKEKNLTLSKLVLCVREGSESYTTFEGKPGKFTTCDEAQRTIWQTFRSKFYVDRVPALMIISGDGNNVVSGPHYGDDQNAIFSSIFNEM